MARGGRRAPGGGGRAPEYPRLCVAGAALTRISDPIGLPGCHCIRDSDRLAINDRDFGTAGRPDGRCNRAWTDARPAPGPNARRRGRDAREQGPDAPASEPHTQPGAGARRARRRGRRRARGPSAGARASPGTGSRASNGRRRGVPTRGSSVPSAVCQRDGRSGSIVARSGLGWVRAGRPAAFV